METRSDPRQPSPTPGRDYPPTVEPAARITGSESLTKLVPALIAARAAMPVVTKDKENPHFRSRYADLASIRDAAAGPLRDNGICILQSTRWDHGDLFLNTSLIHVSGEWVAFNYPVFARYDEPQKLGAALTYAKRLSLQTILDIAPEDADGETASGRGQGRQQQGQGRRDDRSRYQDRDRRAVNQAFQEHAATGERPPVKPKARKSWNDFVTNTLKAEHDSWRNEMALEGIAPEKRHEYNELATVFQVVNHLCSRLIELGRLTAEDVGKDGKPTTRDPSKAMRAVVDFWGHSPASIRKAVTKYLAQKRSEARATLGMPDLDDDDDAEPVAAQGREPGEDG